jgi:hypothetical protein
LSYGEQADVGASRITRLLSLLRDSCDDLDLESGSANVDAKLDAIATARFERKDIFTGVDRGLRTIGEHRAPRVEVPTGDRKRSRYIGQADLRAHIQRGATKEAPVK